MEAISGGTITRTKPTTTASPYSVGTRVADGRQGEANLDAGSHGHGQAGGRQQRNSQDRRSDS